MKNYIQCHVYAKNWFAQALFNIFKKSIVDIVQDRLDETLKFTLHSNFNILHQVHPVWNGSAYEIVLSSDAVPQDVIKLVVNEFPDVHAFLFTEQELKLICKFDKTPQGNS